MALEKAKVESGVLVVERWIMAALRKRKFFSLSEVNQVVAELLTRLNNRPFRKAAGTRRSLFEVLDQPALRALPAERYRSTPIGSPFGAFAVGSKARAQTHR